MNNRWLAHYSNIRPHRSLDLPQLVVPLFKLVFPPLALSLQELEVYIPVSCAVEYDYIFLQFSTKTLASSKVVKISPFNSSSLSFPLNDSLYPFSQGEPGSMNNV
jgi:hypothetical protein